MKMINFKNIIYYLTTLILIAVVATSCEKDLVNKTDVQNTDHGFVFDGLKLIEGSSQATEAGTLVYNKDAKALNELFNKKPQTLNFTIPLSKNEKMELELQQVNIFSDDFFVRDQNNQIVPLENKGVFYEGNIKGEENTVVSLSIFANDLSAMIITSDDVYHLNKEIDESWVMKKVSSGAFKTSEQLSCNHNADEMFKLNQGDIPEFSIKKSAKSSSCAFNPVRVCYVVDQTFINYFGNYGAATNYIQQKFASVKAIYGYWGIPIQLIGYYTRSYTVNPSYSGNVLEPPYLDMVDEFKIGSNYWDAMGVLVVVDNGGTLIGTGIGVANMANGTAPICKKGHNNGANPGNMPFSATALIESANGTPNHHYFIYVLAHEMGHNFGINQEYNNVTNDLMDHYASGNQHHIAHATYVDMYYKWVACYCN